LTASWAVSKGENKNLEIQQVGIGWFGKPSTAIRDSTTLSSHHEELWE
jgi:hypothetical protein